MTIPVHMAMSEGRPGVQTAGLVAAACSSVTLWTELLHLFLSSLWKQHWQNMNTMGTLKMK